MVFIAFGLFETITNFVYFSRTDCVTIAYGQHREFRIWSVILN